MIAAHLTRRLLDLSREAHAARQHEAAYHALMAAMHAGYDASDATSLDEICREARTQIQWIDEHQMEHRLSTRSASRHSHPGVYEMLARQCEAYEDMVHRASRIP